MSEGYSSSGYRIELLKGDNWVPWKCRMLAVLRDLNLEKYIEPTAMSPTPEDPTKPTKDETEAMDKWREGDARARTRIELAIGDAEMIHVSGASTALHHECRAVVRRLDKPVTVVTGSGAVRRLGSHGRV